MRRGLLPVFLILLTGMVVGHVGETQTGSTSTDIEDRSRGTVMNANTDTLPDGCDSTATWQNITVHAGKEFAKNLSGTIFTYDDRVFTFPPCTKLTVTLVNHDEVRHQWMVHGLPKDIHNMGMFTLETTGPDRVTGTFILPATPGTHLVHCGVPQHEQKGMKAQLKVGGGSGDLPGIPGITG